MNDAEKKLTAITLLRDTKDNTDKILSILEKQKNNVNVTVNKNVAQSQTPQRQIEPVMWIPNKIRYLTSRQIFYMGCSGWTPEQIEFVSDKSVAEIKEAFNQFAYSHPDLYQRYKQFGSL